MREMICLRKYREKGKLSIFKSFYLLIRFTSGCGEYLVRVINFRMFFIVRNYVKRISSGLWGYYDFENLNFYIF